jgi:DNA-binding NtrC family response regulator
LPTVLLVDDQALHRKLVERQLQTGGCRVIAATTGGAEEWAMQLMRDANLQCLEKPFTEVQLRDALAAVLSNREVAED